MKKKTYPVYYAVKIFPRWWYKKERRWIDEPKCPAIRSRTFFSAERAHAHARHYGGICIKWCRPRKRDKYRFMKSYNYGTVEYY